MTDPAAAPTGSLLDRLTAVREWLWRHSSQPNGDPWDGDPEHLDRAAHRLLHELTARLAPSSPFARATGYTGRSRADHGR